MAPRLGKTNRRDPEGAEEILEKLLLLNPSAIFLCVSCALFGFFHSVFSICVGALESAPSLSPYRTLGNQGNVASLDFIIRTLLTSQAFRLWLQEILRLRRTSPPKEKRLLGPDPEKALGRGSRGFMLSYDWESI